MEKLALKSLKAADVQNAVRHPDEVSRSLAAQRVCRDIRNKALSEDERAFAHKILEHIAHDSADMVRRALAITLKNSPKLPRDIAVKLSQDIESIAVPILTHSPVFTDEDLIEILKSKAAAKAIAVAKRISVSDHVARAIIRFGDSRAVAEIAANDGALISEETASQMLDIYKNDDLIAQSMILRRDLPPRIVEKMITLVSDDMVIKLTQRHSVSADVAIDLAERSRERAVVDFIDQAWVTKDLKSLVRRIYAEGRLTPSLLIRAICSGQIRFAEQALAIMSGVSVQKAVLMIHDGGPFGLKALCARAGLNEKTSKIIHAAVVIYRDLEISGLDYDRANFQELMIERVLTLPFDLPEADQLWFLEKLDGFSDVTLN
ncbi:DUF2336 domain-containing protein [Hellea balneolensis]|uniref:DUF2336 domain-containing protein n=1 Tax=Hellea balneolensis TaxID=287478 RepID=UPI0004084EB3|nr:DUF2336 domain-containing protein [Hellea balneolensis]